MTMTWCANCLGFGPETEPDPRQFRRSRPIRRAWSVGRSCWPPPSAARRSVARCAPARCIASIRVCMRWWRRNCSPRTGRSEPRCWPRASGALLSHATAAWRWRIIPAPPSVMQLVVPQPRTPPTGLAFHESGRLRADDVTTQRRLSDHHRSPHAVGPRHPLQHRALLRALAEAEFHHDLRPADIQRTLRRGHPGSANLRAALKAHAPGHGDMKSQLERRFRRLLIAHRIELPLRNEPSARGRSTACGRSAASQSSSTGAGMSVRARPTQTTTAISGCAATVTSRAAMASARSTSGPTT